LLPRHPGDFDDLKVLLRVARLPTIVRVPAVSEFVTSS